MVHPKQRTVAFSKTGWPSLSACDLVQPVITTAAIVEINSPMEVAGDGDLLAPRCSPGGFAGDRESDDRRRVEFGCPRVSGQALARLVSTSSRTACSTTVPLKNSGFMPV